MHEATAIEIECRDEMSANRSLYILLFVSVTMTSNYICLFGTDVFERSTSYRELSLKVAS